MDLYGWGKLTQNEQLLFLLWFLMVKHFSKSRDLHLISFL